MYRGNEVKVSGIVDYYVADKPGGTKVRTHFFIADDMEGNDLLIGLTTMKAWGVLKPDFPDNDSEMFLKSAERERTIQHHINRIAAAKTAESKNEDNADKAHSEEVLKAEGDEVAVNLTEKQSSQQRRKEERLQKKTQYKKEKWILKDIERDKDLAALKEEFIKEFQQVFTVKIG